MGRSSTARERLVGAACDLMHSRGYGSIGVAEICTRADVRKGSFYHFFESKQALTVEVIDTHWRQQRAGWIATLRSPAPALTRLEQLFGVVARAQYTAKEGDGAVNGCLLANLTLELAGQDHTVQARLEDIFAEQIDLLQETLDDAVAEGAIPPVGRSTARALVAQLEGMILFSKLGNDPSVLDDLWPQVRLLLNARAPEGDGSPNPPEPTVSSHASEP